MTKEKKFPECCMRGEGKNALQVLTHYQIALASPRAQGGRPGNAG